MLGVALHPPPTSPSRLTASLDIPADVVVASGDIQGAETRRNFDGAAATTLAPHSNFIAADLPIPREAGFWPE